MTFQPYNWISHIYKFSNSHSNPDLETAETLCGINIKGHINERRASGVTSFNSTTQSPVLLVELPSCEDCLLHMSRQCIADIKNQKNLLVAIHERLGE